METPDNKTEAQFLQKSDHVVVWVARRDVIMYSLTEEQIEGLSQTETGPSAALFGVCIGVAVTAITALTTESITDSNLRAAYIAVALSFSVLSIFFGIVWLRNSLRNKKHKERVKQTARLVRSESLVGETVTADKPRKGIPE